MQPLLITGEMRSGTTFLANFLNSQKKAVVYADMLLTLFMEAQTLGIGDIHMALSERDKNVLLSNLTQEGKLQYLDFSVIDRNQEWTWYSLFLEALKIIRGESGAAIVGVKRTREEKFLRQLLDSGVKIIYCVRDPRDVVISAHNRFAAFNLFKTVNNWRESLLFAEQFKEHESFMMLRYEDLILKKEETSQALATFLGIHVDTDLEVLTFGRDKTYKDNSSFGDVHTLFDANAVYRWKKKAHEVQVLFCENLLVQEMTRLGYASSLGQARHKPSIEVINLLNAYYSQQRKQRIVNIIRRFYHSWLR